MGNYELWNLQSGNLIGTSATEAEVLRDVADALARYGDAGAEGLALDYDGPDGERVVAEGEALAQLARAAVEQAPTNVVQFETVVAERLRARGD